MIRTIKLIHTAIWAVMASASFYILYCGITGRFGWMLWLSIAMLAAETIVLILNDWTCPLTPLASKHTKDRKDNFDIYLPNWLAKHNKAIFGAIFAIGILLVVVNLIRRL